MGGGGRAGQEAVEIAAGELPFEGRGDLLVVLLEVEDALGDCVLGREVGRGECLALEDREVDLDLVHPAGVRGQMHQGEVVEPCLETVGEVVLLRWTVRGQS